MHKYGLISYANLNYAENFNNRKFIIKYYFFIKYQQYKIVKNEKQF